MKSTLLLHPGTKTAVESYLASPSQVLLLSGNPGLGKTILAREIAAMLLAIPVDSFVTYAYGRIIVPEDGSIPISAVRSLNSFLSLVVPAAEGKQITRVVCIDDADAMTREAQNALLKMLEEPPERTVFILTTSKPRKLLATVSSRLQKLHVQTPDSKAIKQHFADKGHTSEALEKAFMLTAGNIARTHDLLDKKETMNATESIDLVKKALTADTFSRLILVDGLSKDKAAAIDFSDSLILVASSSLRHAALSGDRSRLPQWQRILAAAYEAQGALNQNGNSKLVLTELMLAL